MRGVLYGDAGGLEGGGTWAGVGAGCVVDNSRCTDSRCTGTHNHAHGGLRVARLEHTFQPGQTPSFSACALGANFPTTQLTQPMPSICVAWNSNVTTSGCAALQGRVDIIRAWASNGGVRQSGSARTAAFSIAVTGSSLGRFTNPEIKNPGLVGCSSSVAVGGATGY